MELKSGDRVDKDIYFHNLNEGKRHEYDGYHCDKCKNRGNIAFRKFDSMYLKKCECMAVRTSIENAKKSGLGDLLNVTLDSYIISNQWQQSLKAKAQKYIDSDNINWFVLLGQSGYGKTHLCSAVANVLLAKHKAVRYVIWNEIVKDIKRAINENQDNSIIEELSNVEVLFIDDLFKGGHTEVDKRYAFEILNARVNQKLTTIISSELLLDDIMRIDVAIAGRIKQMADCYLTQISPDLSKNYRLK